MVDKSGVLDVKERPNCMFHIGKYDQIIRLPLLSLALFAVNIFACRYVRSGLIGLRDIAFYFPYSLLP